MSGSKKHSDELRKYLTARKVSKGENYTHNSIWDRKMGIGYGGCYNIPEKDKEEFYQIYCDSVFRNGENAFLAEKHEELSPILIDIDLRYHKSVSEDRIYNNDFIHEILKLYMKVINNYLIIKEDRERYAFIFEKKKPVEHDENTMKDGIHIIFPYLITEPSIQYIIRNNIIQGCKEIIEKLQVSNTIEDIIDEAVIERNSWLMYGSTKPGKDYYRLSKIYQIGSGNNNYDLTEIQDPDTYTNDYLVRKLSIQGHLVSTETRKNKHIEIIEFKDSIQKIKVKKTSSNKSYKKYKKASPPPSNKELIEKYIDILSPERSENYKNWIEVGWCLHNIWPGFIDKWIEFSKKSKGYADSAEKECKDLWENMDNEGLGLGTLHHWCQQDNPYKYQKIREESTSDLLVKCTTGPQAPSYDVAKVVYELFKHEYACISLAKKEWYEFRNHLWKISDHGINLRTKISNDTVNLFNAEAGNYNKKSATVGNEDPQKETYMMRAKKLTDISLKLRTTNFKKQVVEESAELFYKENFYEKLDSNPKLLGFNNGVYDLSTMEFREGHPEDYVSYSTGNDYYDMDLNDPIFNDIELFVSQVLPNKEVREYVLMLLSTFLCGETGDELFHIWTGSGGNGKSKLIELFELGLGDYCCKLPITVLTRKRACSNEATPELARTKGKRFACLQEPDENEKIQVGLMKELTGGDTIQARALHKEPIEFKPQFHMILTCNKLPRIPSDDGGTWRRLRVVEFTSEFKEEPDPNNPNQFKIDHNLSSKLKNWGPAFIWLLLNKYYKIYKIGDKDKGIPSGLKEPKEVKACTKNYRVLNDVYAEFIDENIEEYPKGNLTMHEIFGVFKLWYKETYGDVKCPSKKDLKNYMEKKYGNGQGKGKGTFRGIRFIPLEDSSDEDSDGGNLELEAEL